MGQFQKRYTDRQKRAVGLAQLDGGLTAQQALEALAAGTLSDDQGPISPPAGAMPKSTAHDCAAKIRAQREGRRGGLEAKAPDVARAELVRRLTIAADRLTRRLERKSANTGKDAQLADQLTKAARAVDAVARAQRAIESAPPPTPPKDNGASGNGARKPAEPSTPLDTIAADLEREQRRAAATRQPPPLAPT